MLHNSGIEEEGKEAVDAATEAVQDGKEFVDNATNGITEEGSGLLENAQ